MTPKHAKKEDKQTDDKNTTTTTRFLQESTFPSLVRKTKRKCLRVVLARRYFSLTNLAFSSSMIDSSAFFLVSDVIFPTSEVKQSTRVTCISLFSSLEDDDALTEKDDDDESGLVEFVLLKTVTRDGD
jgi:hypothetical protein